MPCSGCSALHGVNPNLKKKVFSKFHDNHQKYCNKLKYMYNTKRYIFNKLDKNQKNQTLNINFHATFADISFLF